MWQYCSYIHHWLIFQLLLKIRPNYTKDDYKFAIKSLGDRQAGENMPRKYDLSFSHIWCFNIFFIIKLQLRHCLYEKWFNFFFLKLMVVFSYRFMNRWCRVHFTFTVDKYSLHLSTGIPKRGSYINAISVPVNCLINF